MLAWEALGLIESYQSILILDPGRTMGSIRRPTVRKNSVMRIFVDFRASSETGPKLRDGQLS